MNKRYGFISDQEEDFLDRLIPQIKAELGEVRFIEVGVCGGQTVTGIVNRCKEIDCMVYAAGVDCLIGLKPDPIPTSDYAFYCGDSMDQWRNIKDRFNLLLVDGCHCVIHSMCDFLNYSPLVIVGGYVLFHDTATPKNQHEQMAWPQDHSLAGKDPGKLGVREGLNKMGILQNYRSDWKLIEEIPTVDEAGGCMGMILFQKIHEL